MAKINRLLPNDPKSLVWRPSMSAVLLLALGLMSVTGMAQAAVTLDQEQLVYNGGTSARTLPGYTIWQSFTAGVTGTLSEIDMGFFNSMSGSAQLQIFAGAGTTGPVLQTLTVPVTGSSTGAVTWNAWAVNVPVTAGSVYTFNITPDAATLPDPYGVCIGANNPYVAGTMGINDPSGTYPTNFDVVFRTYVTTAQTTLYTINASATPFNGGTISGAGSYFSGSTATVAANAAAGFNFVNWTENGAVVSTSASYSFNVTSDRTLVANFTAVTTLPGTGSTIVVPNANLNASGGYEVAGGGNGRQQQIFDGSQFWPANETHTISGFAWRPGGGLFPGTYSWHLSQVDVYVWTANIPVSGLSATYADNYASATDRTLVYSGPLDFSYTLTAGGLHPFYVTVPFQVPFQYTPANGNLIVEFTSYIPTENIWQAQVDLSASSTVTNYVFGDHRYPTGRIGYYLGTGLITQFMTDYVAPVAASVVPSSLVVSPNSVLGGDLATGTVALSSPAPAGGLSVALSSDSADATVPASVLVPAGATSASFSIATTAVSVNTLAMITADAGGATASAGLTINAATINALTVTPASLIGGASSTGLVTLTGPAPAGGLAITLGSSDPSATVAAPLMQVPAGATSLMFAIATTPVASTTLVTISADDGATNMTAVLTVNPVPPVPPVMATGLTVSPASVTGGASATGTVTLSGPAPAGGQVVSLSSGNAAATVPASVLVAAGSTSATFAISTTTVAATTVASITASANGASVSAPLTITAPVVTPPVASGTGTIEELELDSTIKVGEKVKGKVTLTALAPAGGTTVLLTSSNAAALGVPASVVVPAGKKSVYFPATVGRVSAPTTVQVTATLGTSQKSRTVTVTR